MVLEALKVIAAKSELSRSLNDSSIISVTTRTSRLPAHGNNLADARAPVRAHTHNPNIAQRSGTSCPFSLKAQLAQRLLCMRSDLRRNVHYNYHSIP